MAPWELTEESFNLFLSWLDLDREAAGRKYEALRRRLIVMFDSRGCVRSEELADETLNRFIRRLPAMIDSFSGDPVPYLLVIARNIRLEDLRSRTLPLPEAHSDWPAADSGAGGMVERLHACLEKCLEELEPNNRELVLDYYRREKQAKINFRKELAGRLGLTANALRIKVHHIRARLHACIEDCLEQEPPEME